MSVTYKVKKGDTLNSIAKSYGYSNYKDAGVSSVPSGNFDLIRPGEDITLNNYDPSKASPIKTGDPVVSSNDRKKEYTDISSELDSKTTDMKDIPDTGASDTKDGKKGGAKTSSTTESTGDEVYDAYLGARKKAEEEAEAWRLQQEKEIKKLLPKTLALLDSEYKASALNIESTYSQLIDEQMKLNRIDIDRTKAYGIQNGGQYMPMEFTNAVSLREKEASSEIGRLNNERNSLLARAKNARNEGKINAMRNQLKDLQEIEKQMRERVKTLLDEVTTRYELTVKAREKKEADRKIALETAMKRASVMYLDDFEEAKDPKAQDELIKKIIKDSGGALTADDYYDIYTGLTKSSQDATDRSLKVQKAELDIQNTQNTIYNRNRNTDSLIRDREKEEDDDEDEPSNETKNVVDGHTNLSDLEGATFEKTKRELADKGYYDEEPPLWFIEAHTDEMKQSVAPDEMQEAWEAHRNKVINS